jgi:hypothetical protein
MEHNYKVPHTTRHGGRPYTDSIECRKCVRWRKWDTFAVWTMTSFVISLVVGYPLWIVFIAWVCGAL